MDYLDEILEIPKKQEIKKIHGDDPLRKSIRR